MPIQGPLANIISIQYKFHFVHPVFLGTKKFLLPSSNSSNYGRPPRDVAKYQWSSVHQCLLHSLEYMCTAVISQNDLYLTYMYIQELGFVLVFWSYTHN